MISNLSPLSFKGTFLIDYKKTLPNMREEMENTVAKHGRIIFDNYAGDNTVLYVMKDSKDYATANFIKRNELKFKYYPEMSTKLQFENSQPEIVKDYIKTNKPKVINKMSELMEYINKNRNRNKAIPNSHLGLYKQILKKLDIEIDGIKHKDAKGVTTISNKKDDEFVYFSPKSKNGVTYVYAKLNKVISPIRRYAVDEQGNILHTYKSVDAIIKFKEKFNEAIKHHLQIDS